MQACSRFCTQWNVCSGVRPVHGRCTDLHGFRTGWHGCTLSARFLFNRNLESRAFNLKLDANTHGCHPSTPIEERYDAIGPRRDVRDFERRREGA